LAGNRKGEFEVKKEKYFIFGMLALALVSAGCDPNSGNEPYTSPNSIKITGITLDGTNGEGSVRIYKEQKNIPANLVAKGVGSSSITNEELFFDLYVTEGWDATDKPWIGIGEYYIRMEFGGPNGWYSDGGSSIQYWWAKDDNVAKYDFKNALTMIDFSQFKYVNTAVHE
jgi:hypothetical protein